LGYPHVVGCHQRRSGDIEVKQCEYSPLMKYGRFICREDAEYQAIDFRGERMKVWYYCRLHAEQHRRRRAWKGGAEKVGRKRLLKSIETGALEWMGNHVIVKAAKRSLKRSSVGILAKLEGFYSNLA
jgi:hypothetical protein